MFGDHIIGTWCLDSVGQVFPMLSPSENVHDKYGAFHSAFRPIQQRLPVADKGKQIVCIYTLFYNNLRYEQNVHMYAKAAVYAYKQLLRCTNILDVGQVRFFIDRKILDIAKPYFVAAGIDSLILEFNCDLPVNYANKLRNFCDERLQTFECILYSDVDMWFATEDEETFDFHEIAENGNDNDMLAISMLRTKEHLEQEFYHRWDHVANAEGVKAYVKEHFGTDALALPGRYCPIQKKEMPYTGISGQLWAIYPERDVFRNLREYTQQTRGFILDDQASMTGFFYVHRPKFEEVFRYIPTRMMYNTGTYLFQHFAPDVIDENRQWYNYFSEVAPSR